MSTNVLFAHVPVDRFTISNGPGARACFVLRDKLAQMREKEASTHDGVCGYVEMTLQLTTVASEIPFSRKLAIAEFFGVKHDEFQFTAIFSGKVVSGVYNMRTRDGWFSLD